VKSHLPNTGKQ